MNDENRGISTVQLQVLKEWKLNCMRYFPTTLQDQCHKVQQDTAGLIDEIILDSC